MYQSLLLSGFLSLCVIGVYFIPREHNETSEININNKNSPREDKINVHLVPHSHDDVGWLQTYEKYYFGTKGSRNYEHAGVQYVISSTVEALKQNPARKFIQVETAYLWKWWQYQTDDVKQDFIDLINNGQLEIINGAWSMNDEAAADYQSTIDQFTWGFRTLDELLGINVVPRVGWQIDPFGHSRQHASIIKQLGFEGLIIGRLDYRDKDKRKNDKALDFTWITTPNLNDSELFTSMFPDFYVSERDFCWDILCHDDPIVENIDSPEYNLDRKVNRFAEIMDKYSAYYQTKNILIPMGGDFQYQAAEQNFINIDKLIEGFKDHSTYNVFYSTPTLYIRAVKEEITANSLTLPTKTDDFFPYASDMHSFWTGYFTSRPTSKRYERTGNNILQAAKQLTALAKINGDDKEDKIQNLRQVMGILQHHDAITGTEKQFVADDYALLLTDAIIEAEDAMGTIIQNLVEKSPGLDFDLDLSLCLLANVSICSQTSGDKFLVAIYNPLGHVRSHYVRLPVNDGDYQITGPDGNESYDLLDSLSTFDFIPETKNPKDLIFLAKDLPPLGAKLYYVERTAVPKNNIKKPINKEDLIFGTAQTGFTIDLATSLLNSVTINGLTLNITQEFLYYLGSTDFTRSSGAYVFRPRNNSAFQMQSPAAIELGSVVKGNLVDEVKQIINERVTQIIRIYKATNESYIEFDWLVGDLHTPANELDSIEVISRFTVSNFRNNGTFYTDSNGREIMKRELNKRSDYTYNSTEEPVSSNYYPVTSRIVIKDEEAQLEFAILNDRAQGGSSLADGQIELMIHRRLLRDDGFGVNQALNETQFGIGLFARGQHYLTFGSSETQVPVGEKTQAVQERLLALEKKLQPISLVTDTISNYTLVELESFLNFQFGAFKAALPDNIHLLTLEPWKNDSYLLRLEHVLEKGEDEALSVPVTLNLNDLFDAFDITEVTEMKLGANVPSTPFAEFERTGNGKAIDLEVTLSPMEIKTFIIKGTKVST